LPGDSLRNHAFITGVTQSTPLLYFCRAAAVLAGTQDIQIFPPGPQTVTPSKADGKTAPVPMSLVIGPEVADLLEASRAHYQAQADAGAGDAPFFDFNHDDREAAAWPKRIFWAGEDPLLGGVRAEVEWSSAGEEAVTGKLFRRFSPAFYAKDGQITGAPVNMGGLVNRAAFTAIAPLFAKAELEVEISTETDPETDPESETTPIMTPEEIAALQTENADLKAALAALQKQVDEMSVAAKAAAETAAKNTVACAAKDGRIPPAAEIQAKWVAAIVADPAAEELLLAMAPNPALLQVIHAKATDPTPPAGQEKVEAKQGLEAVADIIKAKRAPASAN